MLSVESFFADFGVDAFGDVSVCRLLGDVSDGVADLCFEVTSLAGVAGAAFVGVGVAGGGRVVAASSVALAGVCRRVRFGATSSATTPWPRTMHLI